MSPPAWRSVRLRCAFKIGCCLLVMSSIGLSACTPRVIVRANPRSDDQGIRYYRPKPYLLISALTKDGAASADYVSITLDYLPDFAEEYSINVRPGLGNAEVSVALADGWNLTSINQKLDSQTDETIKATGELLKAVVAPTSGAGSANLRTSVQVPARNVPLGYYESVISKNRQGKKQLYGFRYVGFLPFQACPVEVCATPAHVNCEDGLLYGLVFDAGVMTFKPLGEIASIVPPSQQLPADSGQAPIPLTRSFTRSWTNKAGKEETNVIVQDSGSVPITVPFSEVSAPPQ